METADTTYILLLTGLAFVIMVVFFFIGKLEGGRAEKKSRSEEEINFQKRLAIIESGRNELQREIETLKQLNERYLYFLVRVPETVKQLNSNLTFDEAISSTIRFTKDIIDTDCVELYLYNKTAHTLDLEAAYGSNRKKRISVSFGEGVVGKAAEVEMSVSRESTAAVSADKEDRLFLAAPIMFKSRLIGVLGLGKIRKETGNEKRLIAMICDLAGVSLQNCEKLSNVQKEANTDPLTTLYNRKFFAERSLEEAQKALNYNFPISIFMFDIDHFKKYNDANGHAEGDYLLRELSRLLKENTRGRDVIARYGGEEFIVLLPNTDKNGAFLYSEKIRGLIESAQFRNREKQPLGFVSISGGVATFPHDADTIESTIKSADAALYKAKEAGRNRVSKYERVTLS